jgi:two-component system phosphate regulon sensor histidine kinase PhoR
MLWRIYGTVVISVVAALVTVASVFIYKYPVNEGIAVSLILPALFWASLSGACVALALGFWLARGDKNALAELTRVAYSLTQGDLTARVSKVSDDEFGVLGLTLNLLGEEISDRMAALSQERTQLKALFASMVEGIVAIDDNDRVMFANGAADKLLRANVSISRGVEVNAVQGLGILLPLVIETRTQKKRKTIELTMGDGDKLVTLETRASPFKGEQNAGVVVVLHDVTELRHLERVRRDFVSNVSHELKTPLTSIKGYIETLQSGAKNDPEVLDRFLTRINSNASRLVELVQDILSLARIESQESAMSKLTNVDLSNVIRQSATHHEQMLVKKRINFKYECDANLAVKGDHESLRQIVDNLLINAIKYTPEGGNVFVTAASHSDHNHALLTVKDSGLGIAPEHHARIFERFYRVDRHRSREDGGTGLGLSIVKHLVHSLNGKVWVDSSPGCGSSFIVRLPH